MNTRKITVFLVLGMAVALFLTYSYGPHHSPVTMLGSPATAQASDADLVTVKSIPDASSTGDDLWQHFEITIPPTNPPLDMHVAFLVDGRGTDHIVKQSMSWQQKIPLELRVDQGDDKRIKAILEAQKLPVDSRLVTYHFSYRSNGVADEDKTLTYIHSSAGSGSIEEPAEANGQIGDKIMLYQSVSYDDSAFKSPLYQPAANWHPQGYAKSFPPGFVHRLTVYVQFQRHTGLPVNNMVVYYSQPTQLPDNFDTTKM